jgi:hypothetical protein
VRLTACCNIASTVSQREVSLMPGSRSRFRRRFKTSLFTLARPLIINASAHFPQTSIWNIFRLYCYSLHSIDCSPQCLTMHDFLVVTLLFPPTSPPVHRHFELPLLAQSMSHIFLLYPHLPSTHSESHKPHPRIHTTFERTTLASHADSLAQHERHTHSCDG